MSHGMGPPPHMAMSPTMQGMGVQGGMREGMGDAPGGSPDQQQQQQMPPRRNSHGSHHSHSPNKP